MAANPLTPELNSAPLAAIPVVHEELVVGKERVETGRVRVVKRVHEAVQTVDVPLIHEEVEVERITLQRPVDAIPPVRHEGDTLVIPVVREELVVEKRLVLMEEIRITRKKTTISQPQEVTLRREELVVDRQPTEPEVRE